MPPRILDLSQCPHCKTPLARPTPRLCPACGASLQKRHLSFGCLSSAPLLLALCSAWPACRGVGHPTAGHPRPSSDAEASAIVANPAERP